MMNLMRRESELQSSSVAGQITHWVRIGRAIERSGHFDHARIAAALAGEFEASALTDEEKDVWLHGFTDMMVKPGPEKDAVFARRRRLGVGLDAAGNLAQAKAMPAA